MGSDLHELGEDEVTSPSIRARAYRSGPLAKYARRGFVFVPLGALPLTAEAQADWDRGLAEREARLVRK
jgi:hypothetical protein